MSTAPPNRNAKRQRKKEGAQARRAAELAALRRRQRNRRMVRFAVIAVIVIGIIFLMQALGGDDGDEQAASDANDAPSTTVAGDTTTTTVAPIPATPPTCAPPSGDNTDMSEKPTVDVPAEPATELVCQDLVVGDGAAVENSNDVVRVHYVGVDQATGQEFDASWGGEPATFPLDGVISGWTEGIPGMKVGGRRVLVIPGEKGYGPTGNEAAGIGPNDTLVFVIDLLEINPGA